MDLQTLVSTAVAASAAVVLVMTQLLKYVPVRFTTDHPAWVNAILSVVAAFVVTQPSLDFSNVLGTLGTALYIAVLAAVSYNAFVSRLVDGANRS